MKRFKLLLASILFALASIVSVFLGSVAYAATQSVLTCASTNLEVTNQDVQQICDLSIDKQVSVNGGPFVEADTSDAAANANVGDTVTWQITVTSNSTGTPSGVVFVSDLLPAGFTLNSSSISPVIAFSSYNSGIWQLPLTNSDGHTNLPATLTLTTTADLIGTVKNTASFLRQDHAGSGCPDGGCSYVDGDSSNDSNDAWVNVQTKPQVLAASTSDPTLVNTGSGAMTNIIAGLLLLGGLALVTYVRPLRKSAHYKA